MRQVAGDLLESVDVLDEYEPVGESRRSVAFRLTFRAPDRTLRSEEADEARTAIAEAVAGRHGAEVR
jgi:phenylalanyl-tRNA synthetase beta chain